MIMPPKTPISTPPTNLHYCMPILTPPTDLNTMTHADLNLGGIGGEVKEREKSQIERERERERERENKNIKTTCCSELKNFFRFGTPNVALFQFFVVWDAQIAFLVI